MAGGKEKYILYVYTGDDASWDDTRDCFLKDLGAEWYRENEIVDEVIVDKSDINYLIKGGDIRGTVWLKEAPEGYDEWGFYKQNTEPYIIKINDKL